MGPSGSIWSKGERSTVGMLYVLYSIVQYRGKHERTCMLLPPFVEEKYEYEFEHEHERERAR